MKFWAPSAVVLTVFLGLTTLIAAHPVPCLRGVPPNSNRGLTRSPGSRPISSISHRSVDVDVDARSPALPVAAIGPLVQNAPAIIDKGMNVIQKVGKGIVNVGKKIFNGIKNGIQALHRKVQAARARRKAKAAVKKQEKAKKNEAKKAQKAAQQKGKKGKRDLEELEERWSLVQDSEDAVFEREFYFDEDEYYL